VLKVNSPPPSPPLHLPIQKRRHLPFPTNLAGLHIVHRDLAGLLSYLKLHPAAVDLQRQPLALAGLGQLPQQVKQIVFRGRLA
jgi:hypothetical protein